MRRLSGAVALARAAAALALKDETIAAARASASMRSFASIAHPACSSFPAVWRHQSAFSPALWSQQERRKLSWSFSSRAASNSAASPSAAREVGEEEGNAADDSSTSAERDNRFDTPTPTAVSASTSSSNAVSYVAPLSTTVHRLKRLSLFSCLLTTAAAPTLAATEAMPPAARAAAAAGIAGFGLFTTGLLHWFVGPYVHELTWHVDSANDSGVIEVTTLNVLGRRQKTLVPLSRVAAPPDSSIHPQATFCDSETKKLYYVDVDNFVSVASGGGAGGKRQRRERAAALLGKLVVAEKAEEEEKNKH